MKKLIFSAIFCSSVIASAMCNDPIGDQKVCNEMRHLRSQIFTLGEQRDLMQINYPFLGEIGKEINFVTLDLVTRMKDRTDLHVTALQEISSIGTGISAAALNSDPEALRLSNTVQSKCASCHTQDTGSGLNWSKIFRQDWSTFYTRCNTEGRQPYLCKSMYGMFSNLSQFLTADAFGRINYPLAAESSKELNRIANDLVKAKIAHGNASILEFVASESAEMMTLASNQDPAVYTKGTELTRACMQCHGENVRGLAKPLNFSAFKN